MELWSRRWRALGLGRTKLPYGRSREVEFTKTLGKDGEQTLNYKRFDAG